MGTDTSRRGPGYLVPSLDQTSGTGVWALIPATAYLLPRPSTFNQTPAAEHPLPRSWVSDFWFTVDLSTKRLAGARFGRRHGLGMLARCQPLLS